MTAQTGLVRTVQPRDRRARKVHPLSADLVVIRSHEVALKKMNIRNVLLDILATHPALESRFKNAEIISKTDGASVHFGVRDRVLSGDNFVMIGDAAGLADPINANGIGHAMITGKMAAEKAIACVEANDFSSKMTADFGKKVAKRLKASLQGSRLAYRLFSYPTLMVLTSNFLTAFGNNPALYDLTYSNNVKRLLLSFSFWKRLIFNCY